MQSWKADFLFNILQYIRHRLVIFLIVFCFINIVLIVLFPTKIIEAKIAWLFIMPLSHMLTYQTREEWYRHDGCPITGASLFVNIYLNKVFPFNFILRLFMLHSCNIAFDMCHLPDKQTLSIQQRRTYFR